MFWLKRLFITCKVKGYTKALKGEKSSNYKNLPGALKNRKPNFLEINRHSQMQGL